MNSIMCKICGDILSSYHVHDFKRCSCKAVSIDGGLDYKNRTGSSLLIHEILTPKEYDILESLTKSDRVDKYLLEGVPKEYHDVIYELIQKNKLTNILKTRSDYFRDWNSI